MSAAPDPLEPAPPFGTAQISEAARLARERLQEEIDRVRNGVEEMLEEKGNGVAVVGIDDEALRCELEKLRIETRDYVKSKVRKSERRLERSVHEIDVRTELLERRIERVEADRERSEWRIHANTEAMLDGLLREVRGIADSLSRIP